MEEPEDDEITNDVTIIIKKNVKTEKPAKRKITESNAAS